MRNLLFILLLTLWVTAAFAQKPLNPYDNSPKSKIELIQADSIIGINDVLKTQTFINNVVFRHRGVILGCQKAVHNQSTNYLEAYGKVIINQGDTLTIVGDSLFYEGNTRQAKVYGREVVLRDRKVTLRTTQVHYDLNQNQVYYPDYGTIKQDSSTLSSNSGYYDTKKKVFKYIGNVLISDPKFTLKTDSLDYDTKSKLAYFNSLTNIKSKDGDLTAKRGVYNIKTRESQFEGRARVRNDDYSLEADELNYDSQKQYGVAKGRVLFISSQDQLKSLADEGIRDGKKGMTQMIGNSVTIKYEKEDTLYLSADTLHIYQLPDSLQKKKDNVKDIVAHGKVMTFRKNVQSLSDLLHYSVKDSLITFTKRALVWHEASQLEGDTLAAWIADSKLSRMLSRSNSYIIQVDTVGNFNQIKGRRVEALFDTTGGLKTINVTGNGQSIYYALDDKNKFIGLSQTECASMQFYFSQKKIQQIVFKGNPESKLYPPHQIIEENTRLEGFDYKVLLRPTVDKILGERYRDLILKIKIPKM